MKSSRMKMTAVLLTAAFVVTGCGEALYVLEPEEEAVIVSYAAHAVSKFNSYQQDGGVFVMQSVLDGEDEENTESTETEQQDTVEEEQTAAGNTETEETSSEVSEIAGTESGSTLAEALDLGVVQADYVGAELCTSFRRSDVFAVDAQPGKQLLVLKINLTNTVAQKLHIDILAMTPEFRASVNGGEFTAAQTTILPDDLSTFQGDIEAGAVSETVLLFQVPQEVEEVTGIQLKVTMNGNNYTVNL